MAVIQLHPTFGRPRPQTANESKFNQNAYVEIIVVVRAELGIAGDEQVALRRAEQARGALKPLVRRIGRFAVDLVPEADVALRIITAGKAQLDRADWQVRAQFGRMRLQSPIVPIKAIARTKR